MTLLSTPLKRRLLPLLLMAGIYFCSSSFLMQFPRYVLRIGGTAQDAGWLVGLGLIPTLLIAPSVGEWNRRFGGRWPALIGGVLVSACNILMLGVAHVGVMMVAIRLLYGVGHSLIFGTLFAQAAFLTEHPVQRAKLIGWLAVVIQIGNAVGGLIGEAAYLKSNAAFWLGSAGLACCATLLSFALPKQPGGAIADDKSASSFNAGWPGEVWAIVAVGMAFAGMTQFLPPFIDHLIQIGTVMSFAASWFLTPALLMIAFVRLVGGQFAAILLRPKVLMICHGVLLATILAVPWMHSQSQAVCLGLAFGMSYGWLYPALSALAFEHAPSYARGKVSGWLVTAFELGFRLGPIGLGALITYVGYGAMFSGLAATYVLVISIATFKMKTAVKLAAANG